MATELERPAFYALAPGGWRDYVTVVHPPYTAWHLSYVVIGAALAPELSVPRLGATLVAFFLAVGIGAHALDELHGRPLHTSIPGAVLGMLATVSIATAAAIGIAGALTVNPWIGLFVACGVFIVIAYNLELASGRFHSDAWFAAAWGAFPVLVGYFAAAETIHPAAVAAAGFAAALSLAQRRLSSQVRRVRRRVRALHGHADLMDGSREPITRAALTAAPEAALRAMSLAVVALAIALPLARLV